MSEAEHHQVIDGILVMRPVASVTLRQGVQMVLDAIAVARASGIRNLLANLTGLTGFPSPSATARYQFMKEGADAAAGAVRIAMVLRPDFIDPQKFGVLVGRHFGLVSDVFTDEDEAFAWLRNG